MRKLKKYLSVLLICVMLIMTITSTGVIVHASMLPLEEVQACLVLNDKTNDDLASMKLDDVLNMLVDANGNSVGIPNDATTVWKYVKSNNDGLEEYKQYNIGKGEIIDLSTDEDIKVYTLELIIGSSNQLDDANKRYIITVYITNKVLEEFNYELYLQDSNGNRSEAVPQRIGSAMNSQLVGYDVMVNKYIVSKPDIGSSYYLGVNSVADKHPNIRVEVYDFMTFVINMGAGTDINTIPTITDSVLYQDMSLPNTGIELTYDVDSMFFFVYFNENNQITNMYVISFAAVSDFSYIDGRLYVKEGDNFVDAVCLNAEHIGFENIDSIFAADGVHEICLMLKDGCSIDSELYCVLDAHGDIYGDNANSYVIKAVEGHYNTFEDADNCVDIKEQLIPADRSSSACGYKGNYNYKNGGIPFTIFFEDGNVWKLVVLAMEYTPKYDENYFKTFTDKPIIGEADPWLRVTGATNSSGERYDTYVVENGKSINMDTYYGYGYQTIFINNADADLSEIKPDFWYANTDRVYAVSKDSGNRVDENHIRDFSDENQQYTGIIIDNDKENERNYWITFKKLNNNGSELYVYGPNEREVILDEYFEFKHDILIANIGNAPLENINVELLDAENVKLDPYWNVGGNGNDTLAPFNTTSSDTKYGELPNLAKIRLLPEGEGKVKGTLKITAQGQTPVLITLNGTAQNPEITTETLSDAIKYVPYQQIVATNNLHDDWVNTHFSIVDGTLPDGITLNSDTGEIYGVPKVPDGNENVTYKFTVKADFFVEGRDGYFEPSYKEFTLTVKPNTDENVYEASDENTTSSNPDDGYTIKQHIGTQTGKYSFELETIEDTIFTSYGHYDEFVDLWLNGERLEPGVDYDSDSGSTKITIKSQTFENKTDPNNPNTIAMEFREDIDGDGKGDYGAEMHRTAQNFTVKKETNVDAVIAKIAEIPLNITLNDKSLIQSARNTYDALSDSEQEEVTNRQKLFDAETKIAQLEKEDRDRTAANNVSVLINNLPSKITLNDKQTIGSVRNAYETLTSDQKKLVTNYDRLTKAETAIQQLEENEKDQVVANKVVSLIDDLPNSITLDNKDAVNVTRNAYNMLTASQKGYVTNYAKLQAAENKITELEVEVQEQAKVNAVIAVINAIPDTVTLKDKSTVEVAREAYDQLMDSLKSKVPNYNDLINAEATIAALEAQEVANKADKIAADNVIVLIKTIPENVTLMDKDTIESVRKTYDTLTNTQKTLVINYSDLMDAEAKIKTLESYEGATKENKAAADKVIALIAAIPSNVTLNNKDMIIVARTAYNSLTNAQKDIVTNYDILTTAEVIIAELENKNYEEIKKVTFVGILVDKDDKVLPDMMVEIHSVVQTGRTDENGSFQFNNVEFGKHIMYVKDINGNIVAQKDFNITLGSFLALNGNDITAKNNSVFTIKMQLDNDFLTFLNIEEGNKAPVVDVSKGNKDNEGIYIGEGDYINKNPQTGNNINLTFWIIVLIISLCSLITTIYLGIKKRSVR